MHRITEVTVEFYGSPSCKKPFNSLEKLEFAAMPEWKQWHVLGNGEFPALQDLSIDDCPKLMGKLPENLSFCRSPYAIWVSRCRKLKLEMISKMFLEELRLDECDSISSPELVPRTLSLGVNSCQNLSSFLIPNGTETLSLMEQGLPSYLSELCLYHHDELHSLLTEGLQHLTSLRSLYIRSCHQLQSLPDSALPSSLSVLTIMDCPNLQSLPLKGMPSSLSKLSISYCPLLKPLLEFDKEEYWPEIAHISTINIDGKYL
ncbi:hypothetical protein P3S68_013986 [Capsicum galapagoense]